MSDFDFLKSFSENLDKEQPFEPAEGEWEKVAATIDKQAVQARFWRMGSRWLIGTAAAVALIALGLGLYHTTQKMEELQYQVLRLQQRQQMAEVMAINKNTDHIASDSWQKRTIVLHDTIYRTVVVQQKILTNVAQSDLDPALSNKSSSITASKNTGAIPTDEINWDKNQAIAKKNQTDDKSLTQNTKQVTQNANQVPTSPDPSNTEHTTSSNVDAFVAPLPIDTPASIPSLHPLINTPVASIPWPADPIADALAPIVIKPVSRKPLPLSFSIGYTAGVLFTKSLNPEKFNAIPTGLQTELGFGKHFRLRATAEYLNSHYSIEHYGEHDSYIPPLPPLNSSDKLYYVNGQQVLWDFTFGTRYLFSLGKNQRGFVSAAWLNEQAGEQALQYEFKDLITGEDTHLIKEAHNTKFHNQFVQFGAGMEWSLWRGLSLQTEAVYQRQIPVKIPLLSERFGLKLGINYRF